MLEVRCSTHTDKQKSYAGDHINIAFWGAVGLGARRRLKLSLLLGSGFMFAARPKAGSISQHVSDEVQTFSRVREDLVQGEDRS